jgi:hypothetical protein
MQLEAVDVASQQRLNKKIAKLRSGQNICWRKFASILIIPEMKTAPFLPGFT